MLRGMLIAGMGVALPFAMLVTPAAAQQSARFTVAVCTGDDVAQKSCEFHRREFVKQYDRALRGDYYGWRNVAYMLRGTAGTVAHKVEACAWRLFIVASGSPKVDDSDASNMRHDCAQLPAEDRSMAAARSLVIAGQIAQRIGDRAPREKRPTRRLDGTAESL